MYRSGGFYLCVEKVLCALRCQVNLKGAHHNEEKGNVTQQYLYGPCYGFRYRTMRSHAQVTTIDTLIVVNEAKSPNTHHLHICWVIVFIANLHADNLCISSHHTMSSGIQHLRTMVDWWWTMSRNFSLFWQCQRVRELIHNYADNIALKLWPLSLSVWEGLPVNCSVQLTDQAERKDESRAEWQLQAEEWPYDKH